MNEYTTLRAGNENFNKELISNVTSCKEDPWKSLGSLKEILIKPALPMFHLIGWANPDRRNKI